ncbi:MAG: DNA polymerase III subunit delta [Acidimicrobiales bacterium]|nr:DNA polymerase III subunit delta [Acidimicrobiales bacterium]MDP6298692.1 DNA polymerase III subunit delta [Acidimicrobiales bacterium]HJM27829.1 DNA polymerase III subunit delta [Acidimicrobiales bacterium]
MAQEKPVYLIRGDDPSVLSQELTKLTKELVGDGDRSLLIEEITEQDYEDDDGNYSLSPLLNAAQTIPFLTERRIVVGRDLGRFSKSADIQPLLEYLESPLSTNSLILVWEKGPKLQRLGNLPKQLLESVTTFGEIIDGRIGRKTKDWITEQATHSGIHLDRASIDLITEIVGEEVSRVPSLLQTLLSTFGEGSRLGTDDVKPYLGDSGGVPPWELTDSIAKGDPALALKTLARMQGPGGRHQMQIMGFLNSHFSRILRLAGMQLSTPQNAAAELGDKSTFRAKKTLEESRKLGNGRSKKAVIFLSKADLDLRGATGTPPEVTMELLVARLANLYR